MIFLLVFLTRKSSVFVNDCKNSDAVVFLCNQS
jgi:hypothetical protein